MALFLEALFRLHSLFRWADVDCRVVHRQNRFTKFSSENQHDRTQSKIKVIEFQMKSKCFKSWASYEAQKTNGQWIQAADTEINTEYELLFPARKIT